MVPELEERDAAAAAHYNWTDWRALEWQERATSVAHYRTRKLIDLHAHDAVAEDTDRRTKRARR